MNKLSKVLIVGIGVGVVLLALYLFILSSNYEQHTCKIQIGESYAEVMNDFPYKKTRLDNGSNRHVIYFEYKPLTPFNPIHESWLNSEYIIEFRNNKVSAIHWVGENKEPIEQNVRRIVIPCNE